MKIDLQPFGQDSAYANADSVVLMHYLSIQEQDLDQAV